METTRIPLSQCIESSYQNRKELGDVSGLARSIEVTGQITPLIVAAGGEACQFVAGTATGVSSPRTTWWPCSPRTQRSGSLC